MFTDIKHVLFGNPGFPVYQETSYQETSAPGVDREIEPLRWWVQEESIAVIGHDTASSSAIDRQAAFAYDNEGPRLGVDSESVFAVPRLRTPARCAGRI